MDYEWVTEKERENLVKLVGVEKRRVAEKGMTTSDLCLAATEKLIQGLRWDKTELNRYNQLTYSNLANIAVTDNL